MHIPIITPVLYYKLWYFVLFYFNLGNVTISLVLLCMYYFYSIGTVLFYNFVQSVFHVCLMS